MHQVLQGMENRKRSAIGHQSLVPLFTCALTSSSISDKAFSRQAHTGQSACERSKVVTDRISIRVDNMASSRHATVQLRSAAASHVRISVRSLDVTKRECLHTPISMPSVPCLSTILLILFSIDSYPSQYEN
mmetsp:Transcript_18616/g.46951  ORF Transcript_18616/g.46951 Transcript_18616/m.46951 type:complete len:132 (-) Transcript_18616:1595-1990(-)